jgi:hypothetical protein
MVAACTPYAGSLSEDVGGPCEVDEECGPESICKVGAAYPDGLCSIECTSQEECLESTICSTRGVCLLTCFQDSDCRAGYACVDEDQPEGTTARACVNAG